MSPNGCQGWSNLFKRVELIVRDPSGSVFLEDTPTKCVVVKGTKRKPKRICVFEGKQQGFAPKKRGTPAFGSCTKGFPPAFR